MMPPTMFNRTRSLKNTIGNVPLKWYDHLPHIGYDKSGQKIKRVAKGNAIDNAIRARDDPDFKWTIVDEYNGVERTLTERQLVLLQRIREGRAPHPEANMTPDYIPYFTSKVQIHPMTNNPTSKKNFVPSRHEELIVARLQKGIREVRFELRRKRTRRVMRRMICFYFGTMTDGTANVVEVYSSACRK